jgi:hypothetical protein
MKYLLIIIGYLALGNINNTYSQTEINSKICLNLDTLNKVQFDSIYNNYVHLISTNDTAKLSIDNCIELVKIVNTIGAYYHKTISTKKYMEITSMKNFKNIFYFILNKLKFVNIGSGYYSPDYNLNFYGVYNLCSVFFLKG